LKQLVERRLQVLSFALIFPSEAALALDIGPAFAAARLAGALFERESVASRVGRYRIEHSEKRAEVVEMTLGRGALFKLDVSPFR
jgi:hypothetical protein